MSDKSSYREFCASEQTIPLFHRDWWLDAVCDGNWDAVMYEKGGQTLGCMPYNIKKKFGYTLIRMPELTKYLGPWMRPSESISYRDKRNYCSEIMSELIEGLPPFDYFNQNFSPGITDWLPLYWRDFQQTTRYTYVIDRPIGELESLNDVSRSVRRDLKSSQGTIEVEDSDDIRSFYELNSMVFQRQGMKPPYSYELVERLDAACRERQCRRIFIAQDKDGNMDGKIYVVWDDKNVYGLMAATNPEVKTSGALKRLFWEAVLFAGRNGKRFDFQGSMMKPVEHVFGGFGAVQVPFFKINKINSWPLRIIDLAVESPGSSRLRELFQGMI